MGSRNHTRPNIAASAGDWAAVIARQLGPLPARRRGPSRHEAAQDHWASRDEVRVEEFLGARRVAPFDLLTLNLVLIPAAILGDTVGYWIGYRAGIKMYQREKTLFFRKDHLLKTKEFYEKHGGATIVIARFVPLYSLS